jgi:hypothetical protein
MEVNYGECGSHATRNHELPCGEGQEMPGVIEATKGSQRNDRNHEASDIRGPIINVQKGEQTEIHVHFFLAD